MDSFGGGGHRMGEPYPDGVLADTLWSFHGQAEYATLPAFVTAVERYHREVQDYAPDITPDECWQPDQVALRSPRVVVRYFWDVGPEQEWADVELTASDGVAFTEGELLYKIHNAVVGKLTDTGHPEFEGLEFEGTTESGVPVYEIVLGN
jgi:hypothetical protein